MTPGPSRELVWGVDVIYDTLCHLAGVPLRSFFLEDAACVAAFRDGRKALAAMYGDAVAPPPAGCPHLSYGHVGCLGASLRYPEDSEPWVEPLYPSIADGIRAMERPAAFREHPLFRRYLATYESLRSAFPGEVSRLSGLGWEGPITSAVLLRGQGFFIDAVESPGDARRFLELVTDSVVSFVRAVRSVDGLEELSSSGAGLADDFASFLPPGAWPELVLPAWERYYLGITTGRRSIHIEGLHPEQLRFLRLAGITHFEPCVSPLLGVADVVAEAGIPFRWLLPSFRLRSATDAEIRAWVDAALADGASELHTELSAFMLREGRGDRILAFVEACRDARERYTGT